MVSLLESLLTELRPVVLATDRLGHLESDVEIPTFNREIESSSFVLNEMESNLFGLRQLSRTVR